MQKYTQRYGEVLGDGRLSLCTSVPSFKYTCRSDEPH